MSLTFKTTSLLRGSLPRISRCLYSTKKAAGEGSESKPKKTTAKKAAKVAAPAPAPEVTQEAAPSDNTKYLCETYLHYDTMSFYQTEAQMTDKRVGQPSSKTK